MLEKKVILLFHKKLHCHMGEITTHQFSVLRLLKPQVTTMTEQSSKKFLITAPQQFKKS